MRDYLYLWNDPAQHFIVASGITFEDLMPSLVPDRGLLLLAHGEPNAARFDSSSRFAFVPPDAISLMSREDIYSWGDFCWVDFAGRDLPEISKQDTVELLYFCHMAEPLGKKAEVAALRNRFMSWAHDDGWYLKLYYNDWAQIVRLMSPLLDRLCVPTDTKQLCDDIRAASSAWWISNGKTITCRKTHDIDSILNNGPK
jgi:hypothetical protein